MDVLFVATGVSQVFPVAAGIAARARLTAGRRWVLAWGVYSTLGALAQYVSGRHGSNAWTTYILVPIDGSLTLMALSCWQERPLFRLTLRWTVAAAAAVHVLLVVLLENRNGFSIAAVPVYSIIGLAAALLTLVSRSLTSTEPLLSQDWFWVSGGLALYYASFATVAPLAAALGNNLAAILQAFRVFAAVNVVSYSVVAYGLLCPASDPAAVSIP